MTRVAPPSGAEPPRAAQRADGSKLDLEPLARAVCDDYFRECPDDVERYGPAGDAWCVHDSLHLFAWAIAEHDWDDLVLNEQVGWLADVLAARDFPVERLARHLELAAAVAADGAGPGVAGLLERAAAHVRLRPVPTRAP